MISSTRQWLRRHRTKFAIGAGVIGVSYLAGQYVVSKIVETKDRIASERVSKENLRRRFQQNQEDCTITVLELLPSVAENIVEALPAERISRDIQQKNAERAGRLVSGSENTPSELSSGSPSVADDDGKSIASLQSESYVHASQMATSSSSVSANERPSRTKVQLWNELKITSITRVFTMIYALSLLTLLTRIQLNLLGRKNYLASVMAVASFSDPDAGISLEDNDEESTKRARGGDFETNRMFLTFSWWLLHRGWRDIMAQVESAVKEVFGPIKPSAQLRFEELSGYVLDIRRKVEGSTPEERRNHQWLPYMLPPEEQEEYVLRESGVSVDPMASSLTTDPLGQSASFSSPTSLQPSTGPSTPSIRHLLNETSDLIDSPLFTHVLTLLLDAAFSRLTDLRIGNEVFRPHPETTPTTTDQEGTLNPAADAARPTAKLASIMAIMTREARAIGGGVPNEYVQALDGVGELEGFAAVVYGGNLELQMNQEGVIPQAPHDQETTEQQAASGPEAGMESRAAERPSGVTAAAAGVADAAWAGFESVWGQVTGRS